MNISKFLNQTAVYWGNPEPDGYGGYSYDEPTEIPVRWTVKAEKYMSASKGGAGTPQTNVVEERLSRVVVMTDMDLELNGMMTLGDVDSLSSDLLPESNDALRVDGFTKIPNKKATQFFRKGWLV